MSNARNLANLLGTKTKVKDVDVDGTELVLDADGDTSIEASSDDTIVFDTAGSERARLDESGKVLLGTSQQRGHMTLQIEGDGSGSTAQGSIFLRRGLSTSSIGGNVGADLGLIQFGDNDGGIYAKIEAKSDASAANNDYPGRLQFFTTADGASSPTERVRIDNAGNVLISTTSTAPHTDGSGVAIRSDVGILVGVDDSHAIIAARHNADGEVIRIQKDNSTVGSISTGPFRIFATGVNNGGWAFSDGAGILPMKNQGLADNNMDLGASSNRMDDIFATNGTIQTSDQNEKQDIASATTKELNVAKKLSTLFKTFRWKDKVTEKGDKARTHSGIVAQEVQAAFSAEGLDASNYGLFTIGTWWEKEISVDAVEADEEKGIEAKDAYTYMDTKEEKTDGYTEKTRLGVRYPELFSFIFSSIEARLTALESK